MSTAEEERGFVIRDRRQRGEEEGPSAPAAQDSPGGREDKSAGVKADQDTGHGHEGGLPVTFSSFVFSLGTSALMLMGEQLDPQHERMPVNLPQSKEIIDILSMLETKTQGNLSDEETAMLKDMLYALRMKYVAVATGKPPSSRS